MNAKVWRRLFASAASVYGLVYVCVSPVPGWLFCVALLTFVLLNAELWSSINALVDPPSDPLTEARRRHPAFRRAAGHDRVRLTVEERAEWARFTHVEKAFGDQVADLYDLREVSR